MAAPNGYELLRAAGSSLTGTAILVADTEPSDGEIALFLRENREALAQARLALQQPCSVPLEYDAGWIPKQGDSFSPLRDLARSLALEMKDAERLDDLSRAVDIGLNIFDLANSVS